MTPGRDRSLARARGGKPVRVLVTRPERQAGTMMEALRVVGAEPVLFPAIRVDAPADGGAALREAVRELDGFDWVVVTSANGAERLADALETTSLPTGLQVACVGPGTAAALRKRGLPATLVARRHDAEGLLEALPLEEMRGRRVLLPLAAGARPVLREGLAAAGAEVVAVEAYRTVADARGARQVREGLDRGEIDVITFTSSSTAERFVEAVGADAGGALVAAIGPVTAGTARSLGMPAGVVATKQTIGGLIEALLEYYENPSTTKQP